MHSPAPWIIKPDYGKENVYRLWNKDSNYHDNTSPNMMDGNAKLMQSAPAMLKALRSIAKNTCCEPCREAALVAREALSAIDTVTP